MTRIAGKKTCDEWKNFQEQLVPGANEALWEEAYSNYFLERLKTRYLDPVRAIETLFVSKEKTEEIEEREERNGEGNGEGFSIMAILCTLVEFLEATRQGKEYRHLSGNEFRAVKASNPINPPFKADDEYFESSRYFINFLQTQKPFNKFFADNDLAGTFYDVIRCGLLHEARTKKGWKIKIVGKNSPHNKLIDAEQKFVYRDN